jgi:hypothetical protein
VAFWLVTLELEARKTTPAALLIKAGSRCDTIAAPHAADFNDGDRLCAVESLRRIMAQLF